MLTPEICARDECPRFVQAPAFATLADYRANQEGFCSAECAADDRKRGVTQ